MRLKSRSAFPPGEFQVLHPEAGMKEPFKGSFNEAVMFERGFRRKNPALAQKLGLPDDQTAVENWVDEFNANRCVAHGWTSFVNLDSAVSESSFAIPDAQKKTRGPNWPKPAAGAAKAAADAYTSLFKDGPVERALAEDRAAICSQCPQNNTHASLASLFTSAAASAVTSLIGMVRDMNMNTSLDSSLGICDACLCPMKAKVHVRIGTLTGSMPNDVWPKLQREGDIVENEVRRHVERCWILTESGRK